jgi:hypothetical protein
VAVVRDVYADQEIQRIGFFYEYYQIIGGDEDDETESGSDEDGSLKGRWDGLHSPFGFIWSIQEKTGWTDEQILWNYSLANLRAKLADAPHYTTKPEIKEIDDFDKFEFKT